MERKNINLQESPRVMLHAEHLPYRFWVEAMNTACHIHSIVKYFHVFGSKCHILSDRDYKRKMDLKSDEGIFLGYSTNSRAYMVFNSKTETVMESINVVIGDVPKERILDVDSNVGTPV